MRVTPHSPAVPAPADQGLQAKVQSAAQVKPTEPDAAPAQAPEETPAAEPQLSEVVEAMNEAVSIFYRALQFEVTEENRIVVRVINTDTGELIRQIPPQELMETYHRVEDALGWLIDRRI